MTADTLLSAQSLSRSYGSHLAVDNVSFDISKGEVLGFLGPNGAGKSTTMNMLSGNLAPDQGQITINGFDLIDQAKQAKSQIGYLPETPPLYKELTVAEFLFFCGRLNGIGKGQLKASVGNVIERCGLGTVSHRLIGNLSNGYQQRVGIAQAIIHSPAVVILDEPTSGLDPIQIRDIRHLIREIANEHSVILSTHILPEIQTLCDRVQIISQGQLVFSDTISNLSQQVQSSTLLVEMRQPPPIKVLEQIKDVLEVEAIDAHRFHLHYHPDAPPIDALLNHAVEEGWQLQQLTPEQHSLEEVFMHIIQKEELLNEQETDV